MDFIAEEDYCQVVSLDLINSVVKLFSSKIETIFNLKMLKSNWEKVEHTIKPN